MIKIRRSDERGHANHGWLDTYYTFSFSDYYDPEFMGFRDLRVINEDRIEPGQGFPKHGHRDMEIITYMISGELSHRDSMGNGETIHAGEVQRMTAGTGVLHSEFSSDTDRTHLLQIWILPEARRLEPGYEQKKFSAEEKRGKLRLIASRGAADSSVNINQDVSVYASILSNGQDVSYKPAAGRHAWVQLISGSLGVNGTLLEAGDGAAISDEGELRIQALADDSEFLLFDLK
jgi:redox-sensitive bicupin YhaK (pirin superfamily)